MKIQLIHPPADEEYERREIKYLKAPPIGLEIIASAVQRMAPDAKIEIFDGNIMSVDEIALKVTNAADLGGEDDG